ncbi:MAG: NAD(P)-dependent alcohol dehydrogenase [Actinomycetota bacterium]|jgi:aryl-alcohol dehydrogenase|nr:NAD(P)-dependent alcohol dehydrogenase [Actinomycetota bacterium]
MRITAAVAREKEQPFSVEELELEGPRADEVVVRVVATGMCHTDLIVRDQWYPVPLPCVLGHEGAGVVEEVGEGVTKVSPGDNVVLTFASCGKCATCLRGKPTYCLNFFGLNFGGGRLDGTSPIGGDGGHVHGHFFGQSSFATHALATERNVVKVGEDAPLEMLGPLGCGIQTGAGGVLNTLYPEAGSSIAVFGTGAVGLSAIMAARIAGCTTIIGVDVKPKRLELASELGATHVINGAETDANEEIKAITGGGADYSIETTAVPTVLRQAVEVLAPLGTCGVIGAARLGTEVSLDMNDLLIPGKTVRGIVEGDSVPDVFIPRLVKLHAQGRFPFDRLVSFYDMDAINEAAHDAEGGGAIKPILRMTRG